MYKFLNKGDLAQLFFFFNNFVFYKEDLAPGLLDDGLLLFSYLLKILLKITMLAYIFKLICVMIIVETVLK